MKLQTINGKDEFIYESYKEAVEDFNLLLEEMGIEPLDESYLIDWVKGNETYAQIKELVSDYANELSTEECASKNAWRYEI